MKTKLNSYNFFHYFIFKCNSTLLSQKDKLKAKVAAIAFGCFTLGIGLLVTRLCVYSKKFRPLVRCSDVPSIANLEKVKKEKLQSASSTVPETQPVDVKPPQGVTLRPYYTGWLGDIDWEFQNKAASRPITGNSMELTSNRAWPSKKFENDPSIYCPRDEIYVDEEYDTLINAIKDAFSKGKKWAVFRISNDRHSECAAFDDQGNFVIIAGMSGIHTINKFEGFKEKLNAPGIQDESGKPINFLGKYVDTGLQRGGHHCVRFAEIYRYQILKEKRLEAYKKVNGAFCDKKLCTFEDIEKISEARELNVMPQPTAQNNWEETQYAFLLSWMARSYGVHHGRWQEVTLREIIPSLNNWMDDCGRIMNFMCFAFGEPTSQVPTRQSYLKRVNNVPLPFYNLEKIEEKDKRPVQETATLGELFQDKNDILVILKEGNHYLVKKEKAI